MAIKKNAYKLSPDELKTVEKITKRVEVAYVAAQAKEELLNETVQAIGADLEVPKGYRFSRDAGGFIPPESGEPQIDLDQPDNDKTE